MLRRVDPADDMLARGVRPLVVTFMVLVGVTFVLATVGRSWSWTGFSGNENVWEWLQLLAQPVALVFGLVEMLAPGRGPDAQARRSVTG